MLGKFQFFSNSYNRVQKILILYNVDVLVRMPLGDLNKLVTFGSQVGMLAYCLTLHFLILICPPNNVDY